MLEHKDNNGNTHLSNAFATMLYGKRANGFYDVSVNGSSIHIIYAQLTSADKIAEFEAALNHAKKLLKDYHDNRNV